MLRKLDLSTCADAVTAGHLDRLPPLLLDRCLADAKPTLLASTVAGFAAGLGIATETLTMPRKSFGPRPVTVISPSARVVYSALVSRLQVELPPPSRHPDNWQAHEALAQPENNRPGDYLVEFDIASCYEYVDHALLRQELVLRTMDVPHSEAVIEMLAEISPRNRGLPQLIEASDRLADTYLEVMERELLRSNPRVSRYADDFRILCTDWGSAVQTVEDAAETARSIGLILSSDKTHIWRFSTLKDRAGATNDFFAKYFVEANDALTTIRYLWTGYHDAAEMEVVEPDEEALVQEALWRIFRDWYEVQRDRESDMDTSTHSQHLPAALGILAKAPDRIPHEWLTELVFRQPLRLEQVALYLHKRPEISENLAALEKLTAMPRQSPWAKVWLFHAANRQLSEREDADEEKALLDWSNRQLLDRHEVVRSEAAWHLANRGAITAAVLADVYKQASPLTRPALAAACGAAALPRNSGLVRAVRRDGRLMAAAYDWGSLL